MNATFSKSSNVRMHYLPTLEKPMKTLATTLALTIMFLSAGAFAGNNHRTPPQNVHSSNVTVIEKNQY